MMKKLTWNREENISNMIGYYVPRKLSHNNNSYMYVHYKII